MKYEPMDRSVSYVIPSQVIEDHNPDRVLFTVTDVTLGAAFFGGAIGCLFFGPIG
jgi:hypothetical protein